MSETTQTHPAAPRGASASPRGRAPQFRDREEYVKWLDTNKQKKGQAWYDQKIAAMNVREQAMSTKRQAVKQQRDAAWVLWRERINVWSGAGGFEQVVSELLGDGKKVTSDRHQFDVSGVKFEVAYRGRTCCRWDGQAFQNGKKGSREAYGVAKCIFELTGSANPGRDARELLMKLSGIQPEDITFTPQVEAKIEAMRKRAETEAQRKREADLREDPMPPEKVEEAPRRITDQAAIDELTLLMAKERSFPVDYAKRLVAEGTIWFGVFRYRGAEGVVDTGRAIAVSNVRGFRTGVQVGYAGREFREFFKKSEGKGKNLGAVAKGAVFIGEWGEATRKITVVEGVYDAAALRLMRERQGHYMRDDECIVVMTGSRMPATLLEICKERGIEIIAALDNDKAGRDVAKQAGDWCQENGVKFKAAPPSRGEMTIKLNDDDWGRKAYLEFVTNLSRDECRFRFQPRSDNELELVTETTDRTVTLYTELKEAERAERDARQAKSPNALPEKLMSVQWHRKDWNELLQREYRCRALTTVGLPPADPAHEGALDDYLADLKATPDQIATLRASLLVYPAQIDGTPMAVWSAISPENGAVVGFEAFPLRADRGKGLSAGATWYARPSLGSPEQSDVLAVADTPEAAIRAWSPGIYTIVCQDDEIPQVALDAAMKDGMAVTPVFMPNDDTLRREALLARWARANELSYRAPALPVASSPSLSR